MSELLSPHTCLELAGAPHTALALTCLWLCSPPFPLLVTETLWGGIIFQFSLHRLLKMKLVLKTEMMDAMVICKSRVIAPIGTHTV